MDRYQIVLGHYTFYTLNYNGQACPFYERLCKISKYFSPGRLWKDSDILHQENREAFWIYNGLAKKHNLEQLKLPDIELLFSDSHGINIPNHFAESYPDRLTLEQIQNLSDPKNESYWDTWNDILNNIELEDKQSNKYYLHQDGDLWAIPKDWEYIDPEEYREFFGDQ